MHSKFVSPKCTGELEIVRTYQPKPRKVLILNFTPISDIGVSQLQFLSGDYIPLIGAYSLEIRLLTKKRLYHDLFEYDLYLYKFIYHIFVL